VFFERGADGFEPDVLDHFKFEEALSQQAQPPARLSGGQGRARERNQLGLLLPVELAGLALKLLLALNGGQNASLTGSLPDVGNRHLGDLELSRDGAVRSRTALFWAPAIVTHQQDTSAGLLTDAAPRRERDLLQGRALFLAQQDDVLLG
jgi:hypothetical protein